jgi:hypothetical protein
MTSDPQIAALVAGLTEAQRRALTDDAHLARSIPWREPYLMTFQRSNTHRKLREFGLISNDGTVLPLGLAVRDALRGGEG